MSEPITAAGSAGASDASPDDGADTPIGSTARRRKRVSSEKVEQYIIGGSVVVALLIAWQLIAGHATTKLVLPTPSDVWSAFRDYAKGNLSTDVAASAKELGYGYLIALLCGIPLGLLAGWYRRFRYAVSPFLWFFYSVPIIALTPLIIVWVGLGLESKVIVVALAAFFPVMVNTMSGVRSVDPALIRLEHALCATDLQRLRTLVLPGALPYVLTGMRLSVGYAVIGVYVGELAGGAQRGIGYTMTNAGDTFETAQVFVGLIILGLTGIALSGLIGIVQLRVQRKRGKS
jgi:NitT/TauT family transport system permease protein